MKLRAAHADQEAVDDGQRQRQADLDAAALTGLAAASIEPRSASMLRRTTSMPTPRPLRLVTFSAVEKPGSKISFRISASGHHVARHQAALQARCQHLVAPDAAAVVADADQDVAASWQADSTSRPCAGLPAAVRSRGSPARGPARCAPGASAGRRCARPPTCPARSRRPAVPAPRPCRARWRCRAPRGESARRSRRSAPCAACSVLLRISSISRPTCWLAFAQRPLAGLPRQHRRAGAGDHQFAQQVDHRVQPVGLHADEALVLEHRRGAAVARLLLLVSAHHHLRAEAADGFQHLAQAGCRPSGWRRWCCACSACCSWMREMAPTSTRMSPRRGRSGRASISRT
jgi:hypothetical protein